MKEAVKVLVIRPGAIGDFVVTLPVFQIFREAFPRCWLAVAAKNRVGSLVKGTVDEFIDFEGRLLVPFFRETVDVLREECRYVSHFDLVVSYLGKTGLVSKNFLALTETQVINADALPPPNYERPITEFLLEPLAGIVDISCPPLPSVPIDNESKELARGFLSASGIRSSGPILAVHPGSGGRQKVSPAENLCRAVNRVKQEFPDVTVLAIEGEADEEAVCAFGRRLRTDYVRVRKDDLLEVAAILSEVSLFVGNDSGIAHLAAAVGVPTVAVFRASNPAVWAPRGKYVRVARDDSLPDIVEEVARKALGARSNGAANREKPRNPYGRRNV